MKTYHVTLIILTMIVIIASKSFASTTSDATDIYKYVIDLSPSEQLHELYIASKPELKNYKLYTIRRETTSIITYNIRLGFFKTHEDAQRVLIMVNKYNISGNVDTIKTDELNIVDQWAQQLTITSGAMISTWDNKPVPIEYLMKIADKAMLDKNYVKAIGLYTKIINTQSKSRQQDAQEKLALARERNNQLAHAKAEYQIYLDRYPGGEGAIRVKRRLNRLITQQLSGNLISNSSQIQTKEIDWQHNGNLYQFYHRNTIDVDGENSITSNSLLSTNINYTGRTINNLSPIEINFSATNHHDIENSSSNETRVTSIYFDMTSENRLFDIKIGRQKIRNTSIFNRFDGIEAGYMVSPDIKARLILGYPVEHNKTVEDRKDKYFYSAAITLFPERSDWNTSLYYLEQKTDSVLDRQEIAFDTRHRNKQSSFYSIVDYSLQYETLNLFLATFNIQYNNKSSLNIIANYRRNPFLTTTNALLGQTGVSSIADLLNTYTEDEVMQLSLDRTTSYKSLSAYYTYYLNSDTQINTDITAYNMSGTVASAGVEAIQDSDNEYSYSLGLTRRNLFTKDDTNTINTRYGKLTDSDQLSLSVSSKFRIDRDWLIKPGFTYDTRTYKDSRSSYAIRPSLSVSNRINRHWQFEMDISYDDIKTENPVNTMSDETNKQFYAGYVYTF